MTPVSDSKPTFIRRRILLLLAGLSLVSYTLRTNISVAAKFMMPDLGLDEIQMGQVFSAFMLGYAIFQVPAGYWGDRRGPRVVLSIAALGWAVATLLTGLAPGMLIGAGLGAFLFLLVLRFALGAAEAATFPVAARAVASWMPVTERTFANGLVIAGSTLGMIFGPPAISWLMATRGWRSVFFVTSVLGFIIAALWYWYATDRPAEHRDVNEAERRIIAAGGLPLDAPARAPWRELLTNRNLRWICLSYFLDSFVLFIFIFWFYLYLTDERGFSVLKGGVYNSLPYIFATLLLPLFGRLTDTISIARGRTQGRRLMAMGCLISSAMFLFIGARVAAPIPAILCLSLSVGFLLSTEGPFWATSTEVTGPNAATAGGIMNMAGNAGGVISTALTPLLFRTFGWNSTFLLCGAMTITAGLLWLMIDAEDSSITVDEVAEASL